MITKVVINEQIQNQLDRDIKRGKIEAEVRELIVLWKLEIEDIGYKEYIESQLAVSLNDHSLSEARQGERAIELNNTGGRLIYKYYRNKVLVKVVKITPDHNYE